MKRNQNEKSIDNRNHNKKNDYLYTDYNKTPNQNTNNNNNFKIISQTISNTINDINKKINIKKK